MVLTVVAAADLLVVVRAAEARDAAAVTVVAAAHVVVGVVATLRLWLIPHPSVTSVPPTATSLVVSGLAAALLSLGAVWLVRDARRAA